MRLSDLSATDLVARLREGLAWRVGPFVVRLSTPLEHVARHLGDMYADFPVVEAPDWIDADVTVRRDGWLRRRVSIRADGTAVYRGVSFAHAVPLVEWTLNLCAFHRPSNHLLVHAAVLERQGGAAVFPGGAGSGKSTLCAALAHRGWRLLSDEVAAICPDTRRIIPVPRPVSLKEQSIDVVKRFAPQARFGPTWPDTAKGNLAHLFPPRPSVLRMNEPAAPGWVAFPAFTPEAKAELAPLSKAQGLLRCAQHAFNYTVLGRRGFDTLAALIDRCDCFELRYGDLEEATALVNARWARPAEVAQPG